TPAATTAWTTPPRGSGCPRPASRSIARCPMRLRTTSRCSSISCCPELGPRARAGGAGTRYPWRPPEVRMRALVTGSNGTVGSVLCHKLARAGWGLVRWDRSEVPIDHYESMEVFVRRERPDVLFHLAAASQPYETGEARAAESWRVNYEWTSELAWITRKLGIGFVFTSTVMVFTDAKPGPYTIASRPDAAHDYGMEKRRAEERVFDQNPQAKVARLGWQIGTDLQGNQMAAWLAQRGQVRASARWIPACSFLEDTVEALLWIAGARP